MLSSRKEMIEGIVDYMREREPHDDVNQDVYAAMIVWEVTLDAWGSQKRAMNFAQAVRAGFDERGICEMRRWAGLAGRAIETGFDNAQEDLGPTLCTYGLSYDLEWVPKVLHDYANARYRGPDVSAVGMLFPSGDEGVVWAKDHFIGHIADAIVMGQGDDELANLAPISSWFDPDSR